LIDSFTNELNSILRDVLRSFLTLQHEGE
jgi:hypothetical protein